MEFFCLDFINSIWPTPDYGTGFIDRLPDPEWRTKWLDKWSYPPVEAVTEEQVEEGQELRTVLRETLTQFSASGVLSDQQCEFLNDRLAEAQFTYAIIGPGMSPGLTVRSHREGWYGALDEVVRSFAELLTHVDSRRLKFCENDECQWAFYDESRNRSRRWCDDTCGNRVKVRRFRERRKAKSP